MSCLANLSEGLNFALKQLEIDSVDHLYNFDGAIVLAISVVGEGTELQLSELLVHTLHENMLQNFR